MKINFKMPEGFKAIREKTLHLKIRIQSLKWRKNMENISDNTHDAAGGVEVMAPNDSDKAETAENMKVVFSDRAYASILAETAEKIHTETGGLFLGAVEGNTWYVVEVIDPGPNSIFEVAYFEYDQKYTRHLINKIANLYDATLDLIGLWHRHPGSFDIFSQTDDGTNTQYAAMRPEGAVSMLVNIDPQLRFTVYHVAQKCRYTRIPYEVGTRKIPEKYLKLKSLKRFERIMRVRIK